MILGAPSRPASGGNARVTLDDLFRRAALRRPDATALADAPNRAAFTDGAPRRLTYAQADRIVSGIAGQLHEMGLQADTVVAMQMPNVVESVLALLGVLRAGMIAAPMPLLWRRADAVAALGRVGAKVLITCGHVGAFDHCEMAMHVAAELFPIRYVCAFGTAVPDGVAPFDLDTIARAEPPDPVERSGNPAAHVAVVTWDVTAEGLVPVARNHTQLIFGALPVLLENRLHQDVALLSTVPGSSFAGLCAALVPWLLIGGTLALHGSFDADILAEQCLGEKCGAVVVPGAVAVRLAETGLLADLGSPRAIIALWRSPERVAGSAPYRGDGFALTDVQIFGEVGLTAARRDADGRPASIGLGPIRTPRGIAGAALVGQIARTPAGTIAFTGPMVAPDPFPPVAGRSDEPRLSVLTGGFVDTRYPCRVDAETQAMTVTGPPPGVVTVGSYRFAWRELQDALAQVDDSLSLSAMPDPVIGQRLVGSAANVARAKQILGENGFNPLIAAALGECEAESAATAA